MSITTRHFGYGCNKGVCHESPCDPPCDQSEIEADAMDPHAEVAKVVGSPYRLVDMDPHAEVFFTQSYVDAVTADLTADLTAERDALVAQAVVDEQRFVRWMDRALVAEADHDQLRNELKVMTEDRDYLLADRDFRLPDAEKLKVMTEDRDYLLADRDFLLPDAEAWRKLTRLSDEARHHLAALSRQEYDGALTAPDDCPFDTCDAPMTVGDQCRCDAIRSNALTEPEHEHVPGNPHTHPGGDVDHYHSLSGKPVALTEPEENDE
jgi:hypothetical protein